jgi:hypothetical protein
MLQGDLVRRETIRRCAMLLWFAGVGSTYYVLFLDKYFLDAGRIRHLLDLLKRLGSGH